MPRRDSGAGRRVRRPGTLPGMAAADLPALDTPLARLADFLIDGLLILDPESGHPCYANVAAKAMARSLAPDEGENCCEWLLERLPPDCIEEARRTGSWRGSITLSTDKGESALQINIRTFSGVGAGSGTAVFVLIRDVTAELSRERELQRRHTELQLAYVRIAGAQEQLLQSEKMASIGQLAAGVAHEINNPIGYVHSNLGTLQEYLRNLISLLDAYDRALRSDGDREAARAELDELRERYDVDFVSQDLPELLAESREGIERVRKIVQDLKDFSYAGRGEAWSRVDIHKGLDSTLNIVWNEIKYKARLEKRYGELPEIECLPSELNQVFMNILVNAGQAIPDQGRITIETGVDGEEVWIAIGDTGPGIPEADVPRIFDPFFTTKEVGSGTGLGLSISYGIVAKHHGRIEVDSRMGEGTTFRIVLPVRQPRSEE